MPPELVIGVPRLVRPIPWRMAEGRDLVEIFDERQGRQTLYHPWTRPMLEGLVEGRSFADMVDTLVAFHDGKLARTQADTMLRRFLFSLAQSGHVDLGYAPAPEAFGDRYRVLRELGRGGVGIAWLCDDAERGGPVVVKHAWGFFTQTANADALVRRESATLAELGGHRGIVRHLGSFEMEGRHHLVRAYGEGTPLLHRTWDADEIAQLAVQLADIVAHVHGRGHLLLDLNPQNFLVGRDGRDPLLLDVGHAVRHDGARVSVGAGGTRGFQAPEVTRARVADVRSDVWSFGRLLFALGAGILPRQDWSHEEFAKRAQGLPLEREMVAFCAPLADARPRDMREAQAMLLNPSRSAA